MIFCVRKQMDLLLRRKSAVARCLLSKSGGGINIDGRLRAVATNTRRFEYSTKLAGCANRQAAMRIILRCRRRHWHAIGGQTGNFPSARVLRPPQPCDRRNRIIGRRAPMRPNRRICGIDCHNNAICAKMCAANAGGNFLEAICPGKYHRKPNASPFASNRKVAKHHRRQNSAAILLPFHKTLLRMRQRAGAYCKTYHRA